MKQGKLYKAKIYFQIPKNKKESKLSYQSVDISCLLFHVIRETTQELVNVFT